MKAYKHARKKTSHEVLLVGAKREAAKPTDPKYIPHPATWLNQERWLDEDLSAKKTQGYQPNPALRGVL